METPRLENEIGTDHDSWNSQCRQVNSYQFYFRNSGGPDSQYARTHTGQAVGPSFAGLDLLDTPGVLWPKFEDQVAALRLAATGAIAGDVFDADTVVSELMRVLARTAPDALREKYGIEDAAADPQILLAQAGKRRGCILPGGAIDYARAQTMILNDFRSGKLGRITLDAVPAEEV